MQHGPDYYYDRAIELVTAGQRIADPVLKTEFEQLATAFRALGDSLRTRQPSDADIQALAERMVNRG